MSNTRGNAYGLTVLSPIKADLDDDFVVPETVNRSSAAALRDELEDLKLHAQSPFAKVPNTYLARLYVLNDVFYQGKPATYEHLKSKYLVFESNFHGALQPYLEGMWDGMNTEVRQIWSHCVGFDGVADAASFIAYIKKCQVDTTFFFMGSTDVSQAEQLKALYLKQEFSKFVFENQGKSAQDIQAAFQAFATRVEPTNLSAPTWRPGATSLEDAVVGSTEGVGE